MRNWISTRCGLCITLLLAIYFCHRLYGNGFILHGDADQNLYYLKAFANVDVGYDYKYRDSFPLLPLLGFYNPFTVGISKIPALVGMSESHSAYLYVLMIFSAILFTSCALVLHWFGKKILPSSDVVQLFVGISLFTGFQVIAVREFDISYLFSYFGVIVTIVFTINLILGKISLIQAVGAALTTSLGLLSGTNVPFSYFFPLIALLPLMYMRQLGVVRLSNLIGILFLALLVALLISSPVLLEGMLNLKNTARVDLEFGNGYRIEKFLVALFTRDWLDYRGPFFHERDVFWGGPVVILFFHGLFLRYRSKKDCKLHVEADWREVVETFFNCCLFLSVCILFIGYLASPIVDLISLYFEMQSVRNPMRFGMLLSLPVAYYAGVGAINIASVKRGLIYVVLALNVAIYLFYFFKTETQSLTNLHIIKFADSHLNFYVCIIFQLLAYLFLLIGHHLKSVVLRTRLLSFSIVAYLIFAQNIFTPYGPWFYQQDLGLTASQFFDANPLQRELGLAAEYKRSAKYASERLTFPSYTGLANGCTRIRDNLNSQISFMSGDSIFLFEKVYDPAANKYLAELSAALGSAKLNEVFGVDCVVRAFGKELLDSRQKFRKFALNANLDSSLDIQKMGNSDFSLVSLVSRVTHLPDEKSILSMLKKLTVEEISSSVIIKGSPANYETRNTRISRFSVERLPNLDLKFKIETPTEGWILIKLPYHPNWHAFIGGERISLVRANHGMLALQLNGEIGDVILRFDRGFTRDLRKISWGLLFGLFLVLFLACLKERRRLVGVRRSPEREI